MTEKTCFPRLPASAVMLEEDGRFLFLLPEKPDWIVVNRNMASLLSLCTGKNSLADIRAQVADHPRACEGLALLERLVAAKFLEALPAPGEEGADRTAGPGAPAGATGPDGAGSLDGAGGRGEKACEDTGAVPLYSLHLNMTRACNLRCVYCYAESRRQQEDTLSLAEYLRLVDEVHALAPGTIMTFTGGEPLLNADTLAVAEYCKTKGMETFLLTNGIRVDEGNAARIAGLFDSIRVSVDGSTAETHDALRGAGSHAGVMRAIDLLERHGNAPLVAMTVTGSNLHEIEPMALRYGSRLIFQPLYKVGRASTGPLELDGTTYYMALGRARGVEPYGGIAETLAGLRNAGCTKCAIGDGELSISPAGDVYPCHMLHADEFRAGNVRTQSFADIYRHSAVLERIRALSVRTRPACRECPVRLLCAGGCWARAYHAHGDLNAADDFCDYQLLAFTRGLFLASPGA